MKKSLLSKICNKTCAVLFPALSKNITYKSLNKLDFNNPDNKEYGLLLLKYFLFKNSVFWDIGANIGEYTYMASRVIEQSRIFAFEPIPSLYHRLERTFPQANIYNIGFSDKTMSNINFKIPIIGKKKYNSRGTLNISYKDLGETKAKLIKVNITTIDEFIKSRPLSRLDMIKIDVEGHELEVIKGAIKTIKRYTPILQIEIEQRHHLMPIDEIISFISNLGYFCYYFDPDKLKLENLSGSTATLQNIEYFNTKKYINNFYFLPSNSTTLSMVEKINLTIKTNLDKNQ